MSLSSDQDLLVFKCISSYIGLFHGPPFMFERSKNCQVAELRTQISGKFHSPCEMITQEECIVVSTFNIIVQPAIVQTLSINEHLRLDRVNF